MEVELIEIRSFLAGIAPFDRLPDDALDALPRQLSIRYLRRGTVFPPTDADRDYLYIVRAGAVEMRDRGDELVDKFGEGELYAAVCGRDGNAKDSWRGLTVEDSLFYLLPCEQLQALRERHREFNDHFTRSMRSRLRRALQAQQRAEANTGLLRVAVRELVNRPPVHATPATSIREAARLMSTERVSALLLMDEDALVGLVTDRDLRTRCLAAGLSAEGSVRDIMTRELYTIDADSPAFEALMTMTRLGVHHLPVLDEGRLMGLVSNNDLIRYQSNNTMYLAGDVRRCASVDELAVACRALPEVQVQLAAAGATPGQLGQAIASVTDALTQRLLELAEQALGKPPVPYTWLAVASQARREQTVHSDQDNALLLSDDYRPAEHGAYFTALASRVNDGLDACGFRYCPGEVMARNPEWRQPYRDWRRYFDAWITRPERKSLMLACNFFDMRPVHGDPTMFQRLHVDVLKQAASNQIFLAHMAANAMSQRPPLGFFRNFLLVHGGDYDSTLDLKLRGIVPIVHLARVFALAAGLPQLNTAERLRAAAQAGSLSTDSAANLEDALELISTLRARHQARQIKHGQKPDNYVRPEELSQLERGHLKDAFSVIATLQDALAQRYQTERFF